MGVAILRSSGSEGLDLSDRLRKFYNISSNEIKLPNSKKSQTVNNVEIIDKTDITKYVNFFEI